jgi:hypothetical protein
MKYIFFFCFFFFQIICENLIAQNLSSPNLRDSSGLKIGEWIETDTLFTEVIHTSSSYSMTTKGCILSEGPQSRSIVNSVCLSQGIYSKGLKTGLWKYYRRTNAFYKQVTYMYGLIQKVEIIHSNGQWRFVVTVDDKKKTAHYIAYDLYGKVESEGDIPEMLLYSNSMDLH